MNETVRDYCEKAGVEFTRCRPYRKNDQAWVEQKNGAVVRRTVGYRRFEGLEAAPGLPRPPGPQSGGSRPSAGGRGSPGAIICSAAAVREFLPALVQAGREGS